MKVIPSTQIATTPHMFEVSSDPELTNEQIPEFELPSLKLEFVNVKPNEIKVAHKSKGFEQRKKSYGIGHLKQQPLEEVSNHNRLPYDRRPSDTPMHDAADLRKMQSIQLNFTGILLSPKVREPK